MTGQTTPETAICSVAGCPRAIEIASAGLCRAHYLRRWRTGNTGAAAIELRRPTGTTCSRPGCDRPHYARDLCAHHDWQANKPAVVSEPVRPATGAEHAGWKGDRISYQGAHSRLRRERGSPRDSTCSAGCGRPARRWVLRRPVVVENGKTYSPDPADYDPLCDRCRLAEAARDAAPASAVESLAREPPRDPMHHPTTTQHTPHHPIEGDTMNTSTSTSTVLAGPILRDLPTGHDDQDSAYWIPPEYRDHFQRVEVDPGLLEDCEARQRRAQYDAADLEVWQAAHDRKAAGHPDTYREWLHQNTKDDGATPNLRMVSVMDGAVVRDPSRKASLTPERYALAHFVACRHTAIGARTAELSQAKSERERDERIRNEHTCAVCQSIERTALKPMETQTGRARLCDRCAQLHDLHALINSTGATGAPRLDSLLTYLGEPEPSRDEPESASRKLRDIFTRRSAEA